MANSEGIKDCCSWKSRLQKLSINVRYNHGIFEQYGWCRLIENPSQVKFVSGTAKGADVLGERFAHMWGYDVVRFPADWGGLGRKSGYVRNAKMAEYAMADRNYGVLIAFWDGKSKGTKHMIDLAKKSGLDVHIVRFDNAEIGE